MYIKLFLVFCLVFLAGVGSSFAGTRDIRFAPPEGKTLLIIGQDKVSIEDYVRDVGMVPGGTMIYTSVQNVEGLETEANLGGGVHHGQYLLDQYPDSVLQIGLWMVDACEGIVKGEFDENIDKLGTWIKKAKRPVFLRIGYEFDFPVNNYEPSSYRLAFRYIVDRFRKLQVDNVAYVWHSYANLPQHPWDPGDHYVDWFAVYVFGKPNIYMKKFSELARQHYKGFMIAESTPHGIGATHGEASWQHWFAPFFQFVRDEHVQVVCYIDFDWESIPMFKGQGWGDARVQANEIVKKRWLGEVLQDKYLQASPELFKLLK